MIPSILPPSPWERADGFVDTARALAELGESLAITTVLDARGDRWVPAAVRAVGGHDPTHYDAVWVRDAVWCHWALDAGGDRAAADQVLRKLCRYFATSAQRERLRALVREPSLAGGPDGAMHVPHIRFDGRSPTMDDVQVGGHPQRWNHKQNDALALFFAAAMERLETGDWRWDDLSPEEQEALALFPRYWNAVRFAAMEDSGAWEEVERRNSSSIGLVTWALERAVRVLPRLAPAVLDEASARVGIEAGYATLARQLPFESPDYPKTDLRYREADAALLALVYPARLERIAPATFDAILEAVSTLVRPAGVLRYVGDVYQCAGYWAGASHGEHELRTDDCSRPEDFARRAVGRPTDTEAEWFFDSWLALGWLRRFERTNAPSDRRRAEAHVARALRQRTPSQARGADGSPVPAGAFPESYNVVLEGGERSYAPSPITPLNWAKASLGLALRALSRADGR
jgi:hypothetical protein